MRMPRLKCKYVASIGVEVECGIPTRDGVRWVEAFERSDSRFVYGSDGSVSVYGCYDSDAELRYWVYIPEEWSKMVTVLRWLWEEIGIQQNSSCGNHIHVRLRDDTMNLLVFPHFVRFFQRRYLYFARRQPSPEKYLARIRSTYSSFYSYRNLEQQVIDSYRVSGSRYKCINYWSLSDSQRTLEFRIMPWSENFHEHLSMITFIVKSVEDYCKRFYKGQIELSCSETTSPFSPVVARLNATVFIYNHNEVETQVVEVFQPQQLEDAEVELVTL
jgi:8-oxo-dGTP pyrophosphatase MutT (NUDIX family)